MRTTGTAPPPHWSAYPGESEWGATTLSSRYTTLGRFPPNVYTPSQRELRGKSADPAEPRLGWN